MTFTSNISMLPFVVDSENSLIINRLPDFDRCSLVFSGTRIYFSVLECKVCSEKGVKLKPVMQ